MKFSKTRIAINTIILLPTTTIMLLGMLLSLVGLVGEKIMEFCHWVEFKLLWERHGWKYLGSGIHYQPHKMP